MAAAILGVQTCRGMSPGLQPVQQNILWRLCPAILPRVTDLFLLAGFSVSATQFWKMALEPISTVTLGESCSDYKGKFLLWAKSSGVSGTDGPKQHPNSTCHVFWVTELQHDRDCVGFAWFYIAASVAKPLSIASWQARSFWSVFQEVVEICMVLLSLYSLLLHLLH